MVLPQKGDIIRFRRGAYSHYGIYIGQGKVIHRAGPPGGPSMVPASASSSLGLTNSKAIISVDDLEKVAGDTKAEICNYLDGKTTPYSPDEIVLRAKSKVGEQGYNVLYGNCEHFVTWCRYGEASSSQVETVKKIVGVLNPPSFLIMALVEAVRNTKHPQ